MSHLNLLTFSTDFCPIKYDLSGDTAWTQASGFQKLAKVTIFNELLRENSYFVQILKLEKK